MNQIATEWIELNSIVMDSSQVLLEGPPGNSVSQDENKTRQNNFSTRIGQSQDTNVINLQLSIRALVNERREIQSRLSGNKGRAARSLCAGINARYRKREDTRANENKGMETEIQKGSNFNPEFGTYKAPSGVGPKTLEVPPDAFTVEKRPKLMLDDSSLKRNRNLFGSLLCHLKKAKTRLDSEKTTRTAELQQLAEQQVSQKLALERKNLAELRRRDFQDRQRRDITRMKDLQKELHCKEMQILSLNLQNHFSPMKNFIRTDTLPMIFWIPALHNKTTERLLKKTSQEIENKIESLKVKFVDAVSSFDAQMDPRWESPLDESRISLASGKENTDSCPNETSTPSTLPIVHPDLINDSDDEELERENEGKKQQLQYETNDRQETYSEIPFKAEIAIAPTTTTNSFDIIMESSDRVKDAKNVEFDSSVVPEQERATLYDSSNITEDNSEVQFSTQTVPSNSTLVET